ncbi:hypothetical protein P879_04681 [Paragonimus westermani]|uniref:Integrase zinc-binding domain-containing protein n=1 Tax=Paragonimus westermani TaxID=34504 RepID=A0A8T0DU62_9TREM|nr:hypothetical protein P879_04681 [Paragonimus westermani]
MVLADTLSRAPVSTCEDKGAEFDQVYLTLAEPDERMSRILETFAEDEEMQKLMQQIREGWPDNTRSVEEIIRPYFKVRDELTTEDGVIFRGNRLVIPRPARRATLQELHRSYLGLNGCVKRGKETVYWPGSTSQVKDFVSNCDVCNQHGSRQPKALMHRRTVPHRPAADLFSHADKTAVKMEEQHPGVRSSEIELDGKRINFQLDSEAGVSLVPRSCIPTVPLSATNLTLRMWNRTAVKPAGKFTATLRNPTNGKQIQQVIFVVEEDFLPLLGVEAIEALDPVTFHCINAITTELSHICENYQDVFDGSL